ncbi:MAG: efflux RND transporter periplasmic adaptor subunit [Clostridiales bacterium]|nr:efflux RND transporter periplasmic adaptor subunit [Clostridiales bacterium]
MKGKLKWIIGVIVIILIGVFLYNRFKPEEVAEYETRPTVAVEQPQTGDIVLYTELTGKVEPQSKATVQAKMGGEVLEVLFSAGDFVTAGQPLVTIDSDSLTALKLQVDAAEVSLTNANNTLARTRALYADGFVSDESMEQAENSAKSAQISYDSAKNSYDLQLEYTTVTAPIDGLIETRDVDPHDHISTDTALCVISGTEELQVTFGITEKTLSNIEVGDSIEITKNGTTYEGQVFELGTMVNSSTGLYDAKATVSDTKSLTNGTRVKITVIMDQTRNAMTVPVDAVSYDNGQPFVYVYQDGVAVKTDIESGIYDSEHMEVLDGLSADDVVIVTWSNELVDGQEVLIKGQSDGQVSAE